MLYYHHGPVHLYHGDCLDVLAALHAQGVKVDLIFADPPYRLSNGGTTCHSGRRVPVHKGEWDQSRGVEENHAFALEWLSACREVLAPNGSIWVSGTRHDIFSIAFAMQRLGYKLLNEIAWFKPNASPNLSCRYFTHSHETLIWAARDEKSRHTFNYALMKELAGGKQMRSVWPDIPLDPSSADEPHDLWTIQTPPPREKTHGYHPTQKPLALMRRIILAASQAGELVLDPFQGSGTTGVAALLEGRRYIGIELGQPYLDLTIRRLRAIGDRV